jgi:hypothetical protein
VKGRKILSPSDRAKIGEAGVSGPLAFSYTLAEKGHPGLSIERAVAAVADFEAFLAEVRERFEVEDDALIYINAHNGRIVERV